MKSGNKIEYDEMPISVNVSIIESNTLYNDRKLKNSPSLIKLGYSAICAYIDELDELGTKYIHFGGDDPLECEYLSKVISYAKEKGLFTHISTSGVGITSEVAKKIKNAGLDYCHVFLDGSNSYIHETTRKNFEEALNALKVLNSINMPISIEWKVNHINIFDLPNLVELAHLYNVKYIRVLHNQISTCKEAMECLTQYDLRVLKKYYQVYGNYLIIESCFDELQKMLEQRNNDVIAYGCWVGKYNISISASNTFSQDPYMMSTTKNFDSIKEYWRYVISLSEPCHIQKNSLKNKSNKCELDIRDRKRENLIKGSSGKSFYEVT